MTFRNPNHPPKGSRIAVEPIRDDKAINAIKRLLHNRPRDLLLFTLGINNGLRASDLLQLTVEDVACLKVGETVPMVEGKTGKRNFLMMNKASHKAMRRYLEQEQPDHGEYLFCSRKGVNKALTVSTVNHMVKDWCAAINLPGNYGSHTLRKTFGYMQRTKYGDHCVKPSPDILSFSDDFFGVVGSWAGLRWVFSSFYLAAHPAPRCL